MLILGLTGSIAMGKSTAAAMFRREGVPVFDADACVHRLLGAPGPALDEIAQAFPGTVVDGKVDRPAMALLVFAHDAALKQLEAILHPHVQRAQRHFLAVMARRRCPIVVVDVPLLFETGGERACHAVAVVSAPARLQWQRLRARRNMNDARIRAILARQMSDAEKCRRADFIIPSGLGRAFTARTIRTVLKTLRSERGCMRNRSTIPLY